MLWPESLMPVFSEGAKADRRSRVRIAGWTFLYRQVGKILAKLRAYENKGGFKK
jgi:hypothetical protein